MFEKTFKALGAPVRRDILNLLKKATVSYHISELKRAGLIREEKDKNYIFYEINASVFEEMLLYFKSFVGGKENEKE